MNHEDSDFDEEHEETFFMQDEQILSELLSDYNTCILQHHLNDVFKQRKGLLNDWELEFIVHMILPKDSSLGSYHKKPKHYGVEVQNMTRKQYETARKIIEDYSYNSQAIADVLDMEPFYDTL